MSSEVSASIAISGEDLDFDECTSTVGIPPTRTFVRSFEYDSSLVPARQWILERPRIRTESIDDAIKPLLELLLGFEDRIVNFARSHGYEIAVSCGVVIYEGRPLCELSAGTVQSLARLNAQFSMDIVDLSKNESE